MKDNKKLKGGIFLPAFEANTQIIKTMRFGDLDIKHPFFESFKKIYGDYYNRWFERKRNDSVFVRLDDKNNIKALLKLKIENEDEDYTEMSEKFSPKKRLKISSLKVEKNYKEISELFIKIIYHCASINNVDEIYGTISLSLSNKNMIENYLRKYRFERYGYKSSADLKEEVFLLDFTDKKDKISNF